MQSIELSCWAFLAFAFEHVQYIVIKEILLGPG